jgi:DNA-binding IclR family transcriptional regulator
MKIQVLHKAAAVLDLLGSSDAVSFTDVWRGTGLNKTTVAHLLETLQDVGYAEKTADGRYRLGPQLLDLAGRRLRRMILRELAEAHALALAGQTGGTATVATLEGGQRHKLAKATAQAGPVLDDTSERRVDLYTTATGRLLLAYADADERARALECYGWPEARWPEVTDEATLAAALAAIRQEGVAVAGAAGTEAHAVAVPVRGPDGRVWAALGCSGRSATEALTATLRRAAAQFATDLKQRLGEGRPRPPAEA